MAKRKLGYTESERVELKKQFLRMLVRMELDEAKQRLLFGFFETYVKLSDEEERRLRSEVNEMETKEKEQVMELIISYEQKALEKGREEGIEQGIQQGLKQAIERGIEIGIEDQREKTIEIIVELVKEGFITEEIAAEKLDLPMKELEKYL